MNVCNLNTCNTMFGFGDCVFRNSGTYRYPCWLVFLFACGTHIPDGIWALLLTLVLLVCPWSIWKPTHFFQSEDFLEFLSRDAHLCCCWCLSICWRSPPLTSPIWNLQPHPLGTFLCCIALPKHFILDIVNLKDTFSLNSSADFHQLLAKFLLHVRGLSVHLLTLSLSPVLLSNVFTTYTYSNTCWPNHCSSWSALFSGLSMTWSNVSLSFL